jgi:hypothetical protein
MSNKGVRKNVLALTEKERKQYFWCVKMLGVLPAFKKGTERKMWSLAYPGGYKPGDDTYYEVGPRCLHDELMANHATCCEHVSFFFAYYHRHLMFQYEVRINYADECLRLSEQEFAAKFPDIWAKSSEKVKKVLAAYKTIAPEQQTKVMAHYWNPTNYNNPQDLILPIEIADPSYYPHDLDEMDELFFSER